MKTRLALEGHYNYVSAPNGRGALTGEIILSDNGSFEGEIYDHASMAPEQTLRGQVVNESGLTKLVFLKFPPRNNLANLAYVMQKEANDSIEGKYTGQWGALPFKLSFDNELGLFSAHIDMNMCSIGDTAEINLRKI
jgi:hypothetical protein